MGVLGSWKQDGSEPFRKRGVKCSAVKSSHIAFCCLFVVVHAQGELLWSALLGETVASASFVNRVNSASLVDMVNSACGVPGSETTNPLPSASTLIP